MDFVMDFVISIIACCEIGFLNLISMGFLGVHFEGGGGSKSTPPLPLCLKPVRIMLETWKMGRKYTHICSLRRK